MTSPRVRWTSGEAEMTIALAPSKRVTTALRWPTVWVVPEAGAPPPAAAGAGAAVLTKRPLNLMDLFEF